MSNGRLNQVLLVGDASARLEVDLVPYGLACVTVDNANEAVAALKAAGYSLVVVAAALPDMTGPAFCEGLLRHFDPSCVVLFGDVDGAQAAQLQRSPKVAIFPAASDGAAIADHLFQRAGGFSSSSQSPQSTAPPGFTGGGGSRGFDSPPRTNAGVSSPPGLGAGGSNPWQAGAAVPIAPLNLGGNGGGNSNLGNASTPPLNNQWPAPSMAGSMSGSMSGSMGSSVPTPRPQPHGNGAPLPFFAAFGASQQAQQQQQQQQQSSSMPPMSNGPDRQTLERIEAMADELAHANAEVVTLRARLGAAENAARDAQERVVERETRLARAEAEASSLRGEVDAARRSAINQVAEVMALSDEGEPITAELDDLKSRVDMAEGERDAALQQLGMVRAERDRLTHELVETRQQAQERSLELDGLRRHTLEAHADVEQYRAAAETAERFVADLEQRLAGAAGVADEAQRLQSELSAVRALLSEKDIERERAIAEACDQLRVEANAALHASVSSALETQRRESEAQHQAEREALRAELESTAAADVDALVEVRTHQAVRAAVEAEKKHMEGMLATMKAELEAMRAEKTDVEAAWSGDQQRVIELESKLGEEQAARLDVENGLRADLNSSIQQLNAEIEAARLEAARADRAVADGAAMRQLLEQLTHEQARVVGEIESLRPLAAEVDKARATVVDMQRQLEAALGTDDEDGDASRAIDEAIKAQTRELRELARAIEPFTWGLQRATAFFAEHNVDGAAEHVRALLLLEKTLERFKNELEKLNVA